MPNFKRATIWGLILALINFVIAIILVSILSPDLYFIIALFFFPIIIFLYSKFVYFRREDTEASMKEGSLVGLYWSVIAIIYDIILVVYILGVGWELFSSWDLIIHYAEIVVFTVLGALTEKE